MTSMLRLVGLVKIFLAEWLAMFLLGTCAGQALAVHGARGCPPGGRLDWSFYLAALLGLLAAGWLLHRIFFPVEIEETYTPPLKAGPVIVPNPTIAPVRFSFCSTHPAYVLIDALTVAGALALWATAPASMGCSFVSEWASARAAVGLALLFPVVRLLSWYVLGRQASPAATLGVFRPVLVFYGILAAPLLLAAHLFLGARHARAAAPVVDDKSFAGGLAAHPELAGPIVHVKGTRGRARAERCECRGPRGNDCGYAEVLLDLGAGGEVVVQARASEVLFLLDKSDGKPAGQPDDAFGRLSALPDPKKKLCGRAAYGPPPAAGRALLEIEYP